MCARTRRSRAVLGSPKRWEWCMIEATATTHYQKERHYPLRLARSGINHHHLLSTQSNGGAPIPSFFPLGGLFVVRRRNCVILAKASALSILLGFCTRPSSPDPSPPTSPCHVALALPHGPKVVKWLFLVPVPVEDVLSTRNVALSPR